MESCRITSLSWLSRRIQCYGDLPDFGASRPYLMNTCGALEMTFTHFLQHNQ